MSEAKIKTALGRGGGMMVFTGQLQYYNLKPYNPKTLKPQSLKASKPHNLKTNTQFYGGRVAYVYYARVQEYPRASLWDQAHRDYASGCSECVRTAGAKVR